MDILHDPAKSRFETVVEGHPGILSYRRDGDRAHLEHVVVAPEIEGRGIAAALTRAALDWARAEGLKVVPVCPYVAAWLRRHPDYQTLVAGSDQPG